jgi:hypothetical protein
MRDKSYFVTTVIGASIMTIRPDITAAGLPKRELARLCPANGIRRNPAITKQ